MTELFITGQIDPIKVSGFKSWIYNVKVIIEDTNDHGLDVAQFGYRKARWTKFITEYVTESELTAFFHKIALGKEGQALGYRTPPHPTHSLGPCVSLLYGHVDPFEITLVNRTSKILPVGCLDVAFGCEVARISGELYRKRWTSRKHSHPRLIWHIHMLQVHSFDSLPFIIDSGLIDVAYEYKEKTKLAYDIVENWESIKNKTFRTAYKSIRRYALRAEEAWQARLAGEKMQLYKPRLPTPNQVHNSHYITPEQLKKKYHLKRKDIKYCLTHYRRILAQSAQIPVHHNPDELYLETDPELQVLIAFSENDKELPFTDIEDILRITDAQDIATLRKLQIQHLEHNGNQYIPAAEEEAIA